VNPSNGVSVLSWAEGKRPLNNDIDNARLNFTDVDKPRKN